MISEFRMRTDLIGQVILALLATILLISGKIYWFYSLLGLLWLWQLISALQLYYGYKRPLRKGFLKVAYSQVFAALGLVWLLPELLIGVASTSGLIYLWRSFRDWRKVARRPVSFWDMA